MIKNYIKIAARNIGKNKIYSLINIIGLAIGIACALLIFLFVKNELTYDSFHKNSEEIYLIYSKQKSPNGIEYNAETPNPLPNVLRNDYPDLVNVVSFYGREFNITIGEKSFKEKCYTTESSFFEMFDFPLLIGNPKAVLENPNSVVLTKKVAEKYFANENPVGQIINIFKHVFKVTGVLDKLPENTNIRFGLLLSDKLRKIVDPEFNKRWYASGVTTFVQVNDRFTAEELKNQFPYLAEKYFNDFMLDRSELGIRPLTTVHLDSDLDYRMAAPISVDYLIILSIIALTVIVIASINFMNLSIARYSERLKEIGVRKVLGANRVMLIKQFISESLLLSLFALFLGIIFSELFLNKFNEMVGKSLTFSFYDNFYSLLGLILFGIIVGIFSGIYPALYLSKFNSIQALGGMNEIMTRAFSFRKALIIFQFAVSIALITSVLFINEQLDFMINHNLGFNKENIIVIPTEQFEWGERVPKSKAFVNSVLSSKERYGILSYSISENVPGYYFNNEFGVIPETWHEDNSLEMTVTSVDDKFLDTYNINLLEGRNFSEDFGTDADEAILLNETAAKKIGWENPIGKQLKFIHGDGPFEVVGVIEDIHYESLQKQIEPIVIRYAKDRFYNFVSFRLKDGNLNNTIASLRNEWVKITQEFPFDYFFISDKYKASYKQEEKTLDIIGISSLLAVFLACVGLFGLTALSTVQRTKEIGIRKLLGASISSIISLLIKQFVILILIANLISWPLAYVAIKSWIQSYPYRIGITLDLFLLGGITAFFIAILAVAYHSLRTAHANPIDSIKYE